VAETRANAAAAAANVKCRDGDNAVVEATAAVAAAAAAAATPSTVDDDDKAAAAAAAAATIAESANKSRADGDEEVAYHLGPTFPVSAVF